MSNELAKGKIDKENFIDFLASATPEDLNQMILREGKPPKIYSPIYFFKHKPEFDENGGIKDGK